MSLSPSLSFGAQAVVPEHFGTVTRRMPTAYWDAYLLFLLARLADEYPGLTQSQSLNLALGDLQLVTSGNAALSSLAAFRRGLEKRGLEKLGLDEQEGRKSEGRGRKLWTAVRRELAWRKVFNF